MPITTTISLTPGYTPLDTPRLILPFLILYIQAYLLLSRGPSSRWIRIALLPASLASLKAVWLDRRIVDERYVIWNFVLGCAAVFVSHLVRLAIVIHTSLSADLYVNPLFPRR